MAEPFVPPESLLLPLNSDRADLALAGGKGANLSFLKRSGFNVPGGFIVTTQAYRAFISENKLEDQILALLPAAENCSPQDLESASAQIKALFSESKLPGRLADQIFQAYAALQENPVAVRSSATAEDLPDLSFAGQQDTYLNILGVDPLLEAVKSCWASLWAARAIGYRTRNQVPHQEISIAVVVQQMVESQVSGVLFTANPLTGLRTETVIDAAFGLGEALVSGQVEPDHYVVSAGEMQISSKTLGAKALSIHGLPEGATRTEQQDRRELQALADDAILDLARLGRSVEACYGKPQDIEWAWAGGQLYLLQSRPITSLFPVPEGIPPDQLKVMFSFGAVQGMFDPITPVGLSALRNFIVMAGSLLRKSITQETQSVFLTAGERIWVNITPITQNRIGRRILPYVFTMVEPSTRQAILKVLDDPRLQPGKQAVSLGAVGQLVMLAGPIAVNLFLNLVSPRRRREKIISNGERILQELREDIDAFQGDRRQRLAQIAGMLPGLTRTDLAGMFIQFISVVASGVASWNFLNILTTRSSKEVSQGFQMNSLALQVTRGMPYNPTTEMDLALWAMAKELRHDPALCDLLRNTSPVALSSCYLSRSLPPQLMGLVERFLDRYGARGLAEIDLGRERWREDPTHVFEMLSSFIQIEDENHAPDVVFARGAQEAQKAVDQIAALVRTTRFGWLKSHLVRFFAGRARQLMGARESPKFFIVRMLAVVRHKLLEVGQEFVDAGELRQAGDLLYLSFAELGAFAREEDFNWQELITSRRESYRRELHRKQIPRLLLSDGRAFYEGISTERPQSGSLSGSPVSPGSIQGRARVVFDPREAHLLPGEIMVCKGTDPSWTPLFLTARGLIMETGGMMTHGAVVAREYGIPAVVGVDRATSLIQTGQMVLLDGSSGQIVLVEST